MKTLHIIETLGRGGAEQALANLLPSLKAHGNDVVVAALWGPYTLATDLEKDGIPVYKLGLTCRWNLFEGVAKLIRLLRKDHYQIIHSHLFFASFYTCLTFPFFRKTKRVVSFHNLGYDSYPATTMWKKIRKALAAWLMRNCMDAYIGVSNAVARHYSAHLGLTGIQVIPNGFPINTFTRTEEINPADIRKRYGIAPGEFLIIVAGRLVPEKGHQFLLEALKTLSPKGLKPKNLIIGSGPMQAKVASLMKELDLCKQVTLLPAMPQSELFEILQAADLFVMPSIHEGFGLAPAEAMALEIPVLATKVGGLTDLVENECSGLLVEPYNPTALADGIERMMKSPELRGRLGKAGRTRIVDNFSTEVVSKHLLESYREVLGDIR